MIHVLLRIAVWVAVFTVGYLLFGPELFDSTGGNPFSRQGAIYLPPAKPVELIAYETLMAERALDETEQAEYLALDKAWRSRFWQGSELTVTEALSGVENERKAHLAGLLAARGLAPQDAGAFLMVVERDRPELLQGPE